MNVTVYHNIFLKKYLTILILLVLLTIFTSPFNSFAANNNTLVEQLGEEPSNLIDQLASDSASRQITHHLYIALLKYNKNLEIEGWAAEKFEVLNEGTKIRFTLRKGILWQDGVELTSDDVEFTYLTMINPNTPTAYAGDYKAVAKFNKIDKYVFEVYYDKPFARSLNTWMSSILPKHILENEDLRTTSYARKPFGCGPYVFKEWKSGESITLKANPLYFEGKPDIETIVYKIISDDTTTFLELISGNLDIAGLTPQQVYFQSDNKKLKNNFDVHTNLSFSYTYLGYNLKHPIFSDKRVRQAFAYAIDSKSIIDGILLGQAKETIGPYRPDTFIYNDKIVKFPYDLNKAKELLKEAGWEIDNSDGIAKKDGKPFVFTILVNQENDVRIQTAVAIQYQLKKIGVKVKIRTVEWAAFINQFVMPGFFDAVILGWSVPLDPDSYDIWHSSTLNSPLNFIHFSNEKVDVLLEEARSTFDMNKRKPLYDKFQEILYEEQPYYFLYVPYERVAISKKIKGIEPSISGIFHNRNSWTISDE